MMLTVIGGCDIEIPKMGNVLNGTSMYDTTTTWPDAVASTTNDATSSVDGNRDVYDLDSTWTDTTPDVPDSLDPPDTSIPQDSRDTLNISCNTDGDCTNKLGSDAFICVDGICIEYLECTRDWHCNNHNACDGEERCSENGALGYCLNGRPLDCPGDSTCDPVGGCTLPGPPQSECSTNNDCLSNEECVDDIGGVCTVANGSTCNDANDCDDFNTCTYAACTSNACVNKPIICADHNPGTKDWCDPFKGCSYSAYILLEITLKVPHNRDTVWLRFDTLTWHGDAPYIMHIPVLEACSEGIRIDLNLEDDSEDGWYECPGNPKIADTIDSVVIDGNTLHETVPQNNRYDIINDPEAPCGKSLLLSRGNLSCPFGL